MTQSLKLSMPVTTRLEQMFYEAGLNPKEHDTLISRLMNFVYDQREQGVHDVLDQVTRQPPEKYVFRRDK